MLQKRIPWQYVVVSVTLVVATVCSLLPAKPTLANDDTSASGTTIWLPLVASSAVAPSELESTMSRALELVAKLEQHTSVVNDQYVFSAQATDLNIDAETYDYIIQTFDLFNSGMVEIEVVPATATSVDAMPNLGPVGYFAVNKWGINLFWSKDGTTKLRYLVNKSLDAVVAVIITVVTALLTRLGIWAPKAVATAVGWIFGSIFYQQLVNNWPDMLWLNIPPSQYDQMSDILPPYQFNLARWKSGITCNAQWRQYSLAWNFTVVPTNRCWNYVWPLPA